MPVWFKAALAQILAAALAAVVGLAAAYWSAPVPISALPWMQGLFAVVVCRMLRLPKWWWPIQFLFLPGLVFALSIDLPPYVFLGGLIVLMLVFPSNPRERVPLYLSNRTTWNAVAALCPQDRKFAMLDLGCGTGGGLEYLATILPWGRFVGVETAPLPFLLSRFRLLRRANASVSMKSLWNERLSGYDVVYAFLSPSPMPKLWDKVYAEMKAGSVFVSNSFDVPGVPPHEVVEVNDARQTRLLVWRF